MSGFPLEQTFSAGLKILSVGLLPHLVTPGGTAPQPATPGPVTESPLIVIIDV
jgi:hypothetical protein